MRTYRRILVPLDGSGFGESALPLALSLAERVEGELHLVSVVRSAPPVVLSETEVGMEAEAGRVKGWFQEERAWFREYLAKIKSRLRKAGLAVPVHTRILAGNPVEALDDRIRQTGMDLVVMATHGRGALERFWLGSVADGLIRRAPCPVLLWRPAEGEVELSSRPQVRRILVPLDGSKRSESILSGAAALARAYEAELILASVSPGFIPMVSAYVPPAVEEAQDREARLGALQGYLDGVAERLGARGLRVFRKVVEGADPAESLLRIRSGVQADLVAMSTRGRGGVARMVLGSVADKVIRAGTVPVLVHRA
jgi:nucleotide-binding universal stress UspA family protein